MDGVDVRLRVSSEVDNHRRDTDTERDDEEPYQLGKTVRGNVVLRAADERERAEYDERSDAVGYESSKASTPREPTGKLGPRRSRR
jgi:hypothetical protein